jgi:hypothetical protein
VAQGQSLTLDGSSVSLQLSIDTSSFDTLVVSGGNFVMKNGATWNWNASATTGKSDKVSVSNGSATISGSVVNPTVAGVPTDSTAFSLLFANGGIDTTWAPFAKGNGVFIDDLSADHKTSTFGFTAL